MSRLKIHVSFLTLLLLLFLSGYSQVNVSLTLKPPYSANINDYYHLENKAIIILTNTSSSTQNIKLGGSISNESRGVYVRTNPGFMPPQPITLPAFGSVTITANPDAMRFFDQANATTNANSEMLATIVRTGKLPEGDYRICIDAYDYNSGRLLSSRGNGCFNFTLSWLDPPVITFPQNNYVYEPAQVTKTFSWTPPIGNFAGSVIEYDQVVVKVQPGQNPNDAISAARDFNAGNPVLNKKGLLTQTYITQPADLKFEEGATYAMQVIARDRNQSLLLHNEGRSEIVVFGIGMVAQKNEQPIPEFSSFTTTQVSGKLRYYWMVPGTASDKNNLGVTIGGYGAAGNNGGNNSSGYTSGNPYNPQQNQSESTLQGHTYNREGFSNYQNSPLAGVTVQLVQAIQFNNPNLTGNQSQFSVLPGDVVAGPLNFTSGQALYLPVMATATTAGDGSFSFNVPNLSNVDFGWKQGSFGQDGEFAYGISGQYRRVLMVKITSPGGSYYADPIQYTPGIPDNGDMGTLYSRVRTYNTTVLVTDKADRTLVKDKMEVLLLRKTIRPSLVPKDEARPGDFSNAESVNIGGVNYKVVDKKVTGSDGKVKFENIVVYYCGNPGYYVYARPQDENSTSLNVINSVKPLRYARPLQWQVGHRCFDQFTHAPSEECLNESCLEMMNGVAQGAYSLPGVDPSFESYAIQFTTNKLPRVYAQVKNAKAGNDNELAQNEPKAYWYLWKLSEAGAQRATQLAAGGKWGLLVETGQAGFDLIRNNVNNNGNLMVIERSGSTGEDGRIDADLLAVEGNLNNPRGYFYVLQVVKSGFDQVIKVVNRQNTVTGSTGDVRPAIPGMAYNLGIMWLQPKGEVKLSLVNEEGGIVSGKAYYTDPYSGQTGQIRNTLLVAQNNGSYKSVVTLAVPSGNNRKIVILPNNTEKYEQDTLTLNVPADQTLEKEVTVRYKLHRIYFNVKDEQGRAVENARITLTGMPSGSVTMYDLHSPYYNDGAYSQSNQQVANGIPGNNAPANNQAGNVMEDPGLAGDLLGPLSRSTNNGGGADFAFSNSDTSFTFRITGPQGSSYIVMDKNVISRASRTWQKVYITLGEGRTVRGTVKIGQVPVAGARVRAMTSPVIEVYTNNNGEYEMTGVPKEDLKFTASKAGSGYVGMEFTEGQTHQDIYGNVIYTPEIAGSNETVINFKLRIYNDLDLSKLLGFPLEVTKLVENAGSSRVRISGLVSISDEQNTVFKMEGTSASGASLSTIDFSGLVVMADTKKNEANIPYCRPVSLPIQTDINEQTIRLHDFYMAKMADNTNGITLTNYGSGSTQQGVAQAKVLISASSVNDANFGYLPGQELYLKNTEANTNQMQLPVFTSSGTSIVSANSGLGISNENGSDFQYALKYDQTPFTVIASAANSRLYKDSIVLDSKLQTNLEHVSPANLNLSIGRMIINRQRKLEDREVLLTETRSLGSFGIRWDKIYLNNTGIHFDGKLTAAGMSMPVSNAALYPDRFLIRLGSLETGNMKLLNVIPVNITPGTTATFGYDATRQTPAWYLSVINPDVNLPAANISGQYLDGLAADAQIPLNSLWFYSNGDKEVNLGSTNLPYRLHNIVDFSLQSLELSDDLLALNGLLDPGMPAFQSRNTGLLYDKTGETAISGLHLRPFTMPDMTMNGIVLSFNYGNSNCIQFSNGQMKITGQLRDENPDVFKNVLYAITKTNQQTKLVLDSLPARQQIVLGSSNNSRLVLSNVDGAMWVQNNGWTHLYFNGDMPDDMGFTDDGKRMRFDVAGALSVNSQSVKLKNVSTPFGDLNMSYDLAHHRLMGSLSFDKTIGTMAVNGDAELVMDKLGYYFMAGGAMQMSNPTVKGRTFMLFGNYKHRESDRKAAIENMLKEYSYYYVQLHELPRGYTQMNELNGFFFEAGAEIPVPGIPNFDIDLGLVSAALSVTVGGDVRLAMGFGEVNSYNLGMGVFVNARFELGITAINVCGGVELAASAGIDMDGTYYSNGRYTMEVTGYIIVTGTVYAGGGLACDSDCDGLCVRDEASGTVGLKAIGTVTDNSSSFRIVVDTNSFPRD